MKRVIAVSIVAILIAGTVVVWGPSLTARPVYSIPQLQGGLTPRHNVWGGRTVWVRAVAVLGSDLGGLPNTVQLGDHAPVGSSPAFAVVAASSNATFVLLSWEAWIAHVAPWMPWLYGHHQGVYRVRFFRPTRCFSCPVGRLE